MPETKDPAPALQPEGPDMPDDEVLYELADLKDLILDALSFQFLSYFQKRLVCIAFFFCASV